MSRKGTVFKLSAHNATLNIEFILSLFMTQDFKAAEFYVTCCGEKLLSKRHVPEQVSHPVLTFITHNTRILFHKAHLYKSIRFIFTCEKSLHSQSELRTAISHVEV